MPKYFKFDSEILNDEKQHIDALNKLLSKLRIIEKKLDFNLKYGIKPEPVPDFYTLSNNMMVKHKVKKTS
jgi:hypothetical protein